MKKTFLSLFFCSLIFSNAFATTEIVDPNGILPISDAFLGSTTFEKAITCGDRVEHIDEQCNVVDGSNECKVETSSSEVIDCSEDEVLIEYSSLDGVKTEAYSREEFDLSKGNIIRMFSFDSELTKSILLSKASDSTITLLSHSFEAKQYLGKLRTVMKVSMIINSCSDDAGCFPLPMVVTLADKLPIMAQLMELEIGFDNWQFSSKVSKFTRK